VRYRCTDAEVTARFENGVGDQYVPVWKGIYVILPVGDERVLVSEEGQVVINGKESRGRAVWVVDSPFR
jgi:hypothetical protein